MNPNITLVDGVAMNKAHPKTFFIPSAEELSLLRKGDYVKVGFTITELASEEQFTERMWIIVHTVEKNDEGDLVFTGELNNDPAFVPMTCGEIVKFEGKNILTYEQANEQVH